MYLKKLSHVFPSTSLFFLGFQGTKSTIIDYSNFNLIKGLLLEKSVSGIDAWLHELKNKSGSPVDVTEKTFSCLS